MPIVRRAKLHKTACGVCLLHRDATPYTGCPTRYRTRHFFNNSNTNEDIATKFEQKHVRISLRKSSIWALSKKPETEILISGKIIKEMSGSVASGTPYIFPLCCRQTPHAVLYSLVLLTMGIMMSETCLELTNCE